MALNPFARLDDAFLLLDQGGSTYTLGTDPKGIFMVEVRIQGQVGRATGKSKPRTITLAIARALKLEVSA